MQCVACGANLHGKPEINIEGQVYCYACAKSEVPARDRAKRQFADNQYEYERAIYDKEKAAFDRMYADWWNRRCNFVGSSRLGCAVAVLGAIVAYKVAEAIAKGLGFVGVVVVFFLWAKLSRDYENKKDAEFRARALEPQFVMTPPQRAPVPQVSHAPHQNDGSSLRSSNYREEILRRDNYTCQACGKKRQRRTLEVNHIIPRSKGGDDDPTNLISLCKYCHDREDWYEHVRKFPTTIKKKQTRYRGRWRGS